MYTHVRGNIVAESALIARLFARLKRIPEGDGSTQANVIFQWPSYVIDLQWPSRLSDGEDYSGDESLFVLASRQLSDGHILQSSEGYN